MIDNKQFVEEFLVPRLSKPHWVGNVLRCRCPLCGDSKKDPNKTRGGILVDASGTLGYNCFNCQPNVSFIEFLEKVDPSLVREYRMKAFRENVKSSEPSLNQKKRKEKVEYPNLDRFELISVMNLDSTHEAVSYLKDRKIPKSKWDRIFFTHDFSEIANSYSDSKKTPRKDCLVFPFRKNDGSIYGFQARFLQGKFRYQTAVIDKSIPKMIGLDRIDFSKKIHVFEGFFDSCFVDNSIAVLDSSLHQRVTKHDEIDPDSTILWYDNEPHNQQIMKMKKEAIDSGFTVVFYPVEFSQYGKDMNDFVKSTNPDLRKKIMSKIRFESGLKARMLHTEEVKGTR